MTTRMNCLISLMLVLSSSLYGADQVFRNGFEPDVQLVGASSTSDWFDIRGRDQTIPGSDWDNDFPFDITLRYGGGNSSQRIARLSADPEDAGNRVLEYRLWEPNQPDRARIQNKVSFGSNQGKAFLTSVDVYLDDGFNTLKTLEKKISWMTIFEAWQGSSDSDPERARVAVNLQKYDTGPVQNLYWRSRSQTYRNGVYTTTWIEENRSIPVPIGQWVRFEYLVVEGDETSGRFRLAITPRGGQRQVIFDVTGRTMSTYQSTGNGFESVSNMKLYTRDTNMLALKDLGVSLGMYFDNFEFQEGDISGNPPPPPPNNPPGVDAGADQSVELQAVPAQPWTPARMTTAAWYDASDAGTITATGGAVSEWADKSGNDNHARQSTGSLQPVVNAGGINGLSTIDSRRTVGEFMTLNRNIVLSDYSIFGVLKAASDPEAIGYTGRVGVLAAGGDSWDSYTMTFSNHVDGGLRADGEDDSGLGAHAFLTNAQTLTAPFLYGSVRDKGTSIDYYHDGMKHSSASVQSDDLTLKVLFRGYAGDTGNSSGYPWDGSVGELILVSNILSDADRQKTEGYLAHKWGLTANLPDGHAYKASAPMDGGVIKAEVTLAGSASDPDGDSLTTLWTVSAQPAGTVVDFDNASQVNTVASFYTAGTYVLQLLADDGQASVIDEVTITVTGAASTRVVTLNVSEADTGLNLDEVTGIGSVVKDGTGQWTVTATSPTGPVGDLVLEFLVGSDG